MISEFSRRYFLKVLAASAATSAGPLAACSSNNNNSGQAEAFGDVNAGNVSVLSVNEVKAVPGAPAFIGRDANGVYAMTTTCTHQGCDLATGKSRPRTSNARVTKANSIIMATSSQAPLRSHLSTSRSMWLPTVRLRFTAGRRLTHRRARPFLDRGLVRLTVRVGFAVSSRRQFESFANPRAGPGPHAPTGWGKFRHFDKL